MIKSKSHHLLLFYTFLIIGLVFSSENLLSKEDFFNRFNNITYKNDIYSYVLELNPFIQKKTYKNKLLLKKYVDIPRKALIILELPIKYNSQEKNQALSDIKTLTTFIQENNHVADITLYSNLNKDISTYKIYLYYSKI